MTIIVTGGAGFIGANYIFYHLEQHPEDRIVCPGIMPEKRRREDAGSEWLKDVAEASYEGGHVILDVPQGGKNFTVTYLTAADESMLVRSVLHFDTRVE